MFRGKRILAALAGTAVVGGLGASVEACAPSPNKEIKLSIGTSQNHEATTTGLEGVDDTLTLLDIENQDISSYPYYQQIDSVLPFLEEYRQESLDAISSYLGDPEQMTGDKKQAQIDLNIIAANIYTASTQSNRTLGKNLVAGAYKRDTGLYQSARKMIQDGAESLIDRMEIDQVSKPFNSGTIVANTFQLSIEPGTNTRLMNVIDKNTMKEYNYYVQDFTDKSGQHVTPIVVARSSKFGPGYVFSQYVADWQPES